MILFPWLAFVLVVVALAILIASAPGRWRTYRTHGADPFVYPAVRTILLLAGLLIAIFIGWYFLFGPAD